MLPRPLYLRFPFKQSPFFLFVFLWLVCFTRLASAQVIPGTPPWIAYDTHEVDTVDLENNNILLNVPINSKSGVSTLLTGSFYIWNTYSGETWQVSSVVSPLSAVTNGMLGATPIWLGIGYGGMTQHVSCGDGVHLTTTYKYWSIVDSSGNSHALPTADFVDIKEDGSNTSCLPGSGFTDRPTDNSGYIANVSNATGTTIRQVFYKDGSEVDGNTLKDSNGNTVTYASGTVTDSMGLTALTETNTTLGPFTWTDVNGGSPQVTTTTTNKTVKTVFGCANNCSAPR